MFKIIKSETEYKEALLELKRLIDKDPPVSSPEADQLELLSLFISNYEKEKFPIELPTPIEAIKFRMEQQGLSRKDLIPYIGSRPKVSEVLSGKRTLSLKMIRALNEHLGIPAKVLLQDSNATIPQEHNIIDKCKFPIRELVKRRWFQNFQGTLKEAVNNAEELLGVFFKQLGLNKLSPALYRKKVHRNSKMNTYALMAWRARVLNLIQNLTLPTAYKPRSVTKNFIHEVIKLSYLDKGPKLAQEFLNKSGIHLIIVRHLQGTLLDGAVMLLSDRTPVIALTLRHDRIDSFWFCLCHELAHISLHFNDNENDCFFDDLDVEGDNLEKEADKLARDSLIPPKDWQKISDNPSKNCIYNLAVKLRIHPAIIAGRIRYEKHNWCIFSPLVGHKEVRKLFPEEFNR